MVYISTKTVSFKANEKQVKKIDKIVKEKSYTSRGEFIRQLLREKMEPELTEEAIERIKKGRKELARGEGKEFEDME